MGRAAAGRRFPGVLSGMTTTDDDAATGEGVGGYHVPAGATSRETIGATPLRPLSAAPIARLASPRPCARPRASAWLGTHPVAPDSRPQTHHCRRRGWTLHASVRARSAPGATHSWDSVDSAPAGRASGRPDGVEIRSVLGGVRAGGARVRRRAARRERDAVDSDARRADRWADGSPFLVRMARAQRLRAQLVGGAPPASGRGTASGPRDGRRGAGDRVGDRKPAYRRIELGPSSGGARRVRGSSLRGPGSTLLDSLAATEGRERIAASEPRASRSFGPGASNGTLPGSSSDSRGRSEISDIPARVHQLAVLAPEAAERSRTWQRARLRATSTPHVMARTSGQRLRRQVVPPSSRCGTLKDGGDVVHRAGWPTLW